MSMHRPVESHSGARENIIAEFAGPYPPFCLEIETLKASRGRKRGDGCPLTIRLQVLGSVVSSPSGVRGGAQAENGFYAYFLCQKEATWSTIFSIFERRRGPQTSRGPGKLPLPPFSTGLSMYHRLHWWNADTGRQRAPPATQNASQKSSGGEQK